MAGIAILLPNETMCHQAQAILEGREHHVIINKATTIDNVVAETRKAIEMGANIVIARGEQASDVEQYTSIPTVEVVLTAQELGLLVIEAKKLVNKPHPKIGLFCWPGMLCDTTYFEQMYDIELEKVYFGKQDDWLEMVEQGIAGGMDVLIGGEKSVRLARQRNFPSVFLETTGESISVAIDRAESMYRMAEMEKSIHAQFNTVLDSSISGIVKINEDGVVQTVNRAMEQMLETDSRAMVGKHVLDIFPSIDREMLERVLTGQDETYSAFVNTERNALVVLVEPIAIEKAIKGAILSCNRMRRMSWSEDKLKEKLLMGFVANETLDDLMESRPGLKPAIDLAKTYAQSNSPILVTGYADEEIERFCQGIHNYSLRKGGPFVVVNLANIPAESQMHSLFGLLENGFDRKAKGAVVKADEGTLVIRAIDKMTLPAQRYLLKVIRQKRFGMLDVENESIQRANARIIACSTKNLKRMVNRGSFRRDLYFLLRAFEIALPASSERKADREILMEEYIRKYRERYSKYHVLTAEAREKILNFAWNNNDGQLESFCERMILTAKKRKITGEYVQELLDSLYDLSEDEEGPEEQSFVEKTRLESIQEALLKYNGNRTLAAESLNISKSTLWRYMKKYQLI